MQDPAVPPRVVPDWSGQGCLMAFTVLVQIFFFALHFAWLCFFSWLDLKLCFALVNWDSTVTSGALL